MGTEGTLHPELPTLTKIFEILRIRKPSGIPKDLLVPVSGESISNGGYVKAHPHIH